MQYRKKGSRIRRPGFINVAKIAAKLPRICDACRIKPAGPATEVRDITRRQDAWLRGPAAGAVASLLQQSRGTTSQPTGTMPAIDWALRRTCSHLPYQCSDTASGYYKTAKSMEQVSMLLSLTVDKSGFTCDCFLFKWRHVPRLSAVIVYNITISQSM